VSCLSSLVDTHQLTNVSVNNKVFSPVDFYVRPDRPLDDIIKSAAESKKSEDTRKNLLQHCRRLRGALEVDLSPDSIIGDGSFKTAHFGQFLPDHGMTLPSTFRSQLCVKQFFFDSLTGKSKQPNRKRYRGLSEFAMVYTEFTCLEWASALLCMVYHFMESEQD
jgi:hypothetical protein